MVTLSGRGLHGGGEAAVAFAREPGPLRLELGGGAHLLAECLTEGTFGASQLRCGGATLRTVEHLFAALAGLGIRDGLRIVVTGDEVPLLDGGALELCRALETLHVPARPPGLVVAREATLELDGSRYRFAPGPDVQVGVEVELPEHCAPRAEWRGERSDFVARIAPARTFALERDVEEMTRRGLARHVDPASVVVVGDRALHAAGSCAPDEPARHKLLDLIGDAYPYGGPPRGSLHVVRPGHSRNHAAFRRALDEGILRREPT